MSGRSTSKSEKGHTASSHNNHDEREAKLNHGRQLSHVVHEQHEEGKDNADDAQSNAVCIAVAELIVTVGALGIIMNVGSGRNNDDACGEKGAPLGILGRDVGRHVTLSEFLEEATKNVEGGSEACPGKVEEIWVDDGGSVEASRNGDVVVGIHDERKARDPKDHQ